MKQVFTSLLLLSVTLASAQIPIINNVTPLNTFPQNKILITGSGFAADPARMQVWFDQVKGSIDVPASTEFSLTVTVPPQARLANIEVTNLDTKLSAKTNSKFLPYFNGDTFNGSSFITAASFTAGVIDDANDVCTCDMDGDGKPDMAATKNSASSSEQVLLIYRNTSSAPGSISFSATTINLAAPTINITCADLNGDGKPELVANRGQSTRNEIFVLKNTSSPGTITFAAPTKLFLEVGHNAFRVITRDLNADGKPEVIVSNAAIVSETINGAQVGKNPIYIYTNQSSNGNIAFANPTKVVVTGALTTYGLDSQDLDKDGKPEIVVNQFNNPHLFILKNTSVAGVISFAEAQKIDTDQVQPGLSLNQLALGDFNNDGKQDIAVTNNSNTFAKVLVFINQSSSGSISLATPSVNAVEDSPFGIDVADIDGDKDVDIISSNLTTSSTTKEITVLLNNGSGTFTRAGIPGRRSRNLRVGDLDGDAKPDIAYVNVNDISLPGHFVEVLRNKNCFVPGILNETPLIICTGQTIRLNSIPSPTAAFSWQNSGGTLPANSNNYLDITTNDTYTVTAVSESGSCSKTASITVASGSGSITANPTITATSPVCSNGTISLSTTDVATGYSWTGPNNFTSTQQNVTINNVTSDQAGNYTLQLVALSGCKSNIATKLIDVVNLDNFVIATSVASNQLCSGSTLNLSVNYANGHSYQWIKDNADTGPLMTASPIAMSVSQDGVYKVRVSDMAIPGCSKDTQPVTVAVFSRPTADFLPSATAACINKDVTFTDQSTGLDSRATITYTWDFGNGATATVKNPSAQQYTTAGSKTVQLTVNYSGIAGCSNSSSKTITVSAAQTPVISATANPICSGDPSVLSVAGTFDTYSWTGPATGTSPTLDITEPGTYTVNTIEANGCTAQASFAVGQKPTVAVTLTADGVPVTAGSNVLFSTGISVQLLASGGSSFSWSPTDGLSNPSIANPLATPTSELTYIVTASEPGLCNGVFSFNMIVDPEGNVFYAPNAFSPNGDAKNDVWEIANPVGFSDCTISIFNRQGSKVFEQKGYTNANGWNGIYNGKELPQGTYYYVVNCPDKKPVTGHVLLAR